MNDKTINTMYLQADNPELPAVYRMHQLVWQLYMVANVGKPEFTARALDVLSRRARPILDALRNETKEDYFVTHLRWNGKTHETCDGTAVGAFPVYKVPLRENDELERKLYGLDPEPLDPSSN